MEKSNKVGRVFDSSSTAGSEKELNDDNIKCIDLLDHLENIHTLIHNAMSWATILDYDNAIERVEHARRYLDHNIPPNTKLTTTSGMPSSDSLE